jgi:hypothetical protein
MRTTCIDLALQTPKTTAVQHLTTPLWSLIRLFTHCYLVLLQVTVQLTVTSAVLEEQWCLCSVVAIQIPPELWQPLRNPDQKSGQHLQTPGIMAVSTEVPVMNARSV